VKVEHEFVNTRASLHGGHMRHHFIAILCLFLTLFLCSFPTHAQLLWRDAELMRPDQSIVAIRADYGIIKKPSVDTCDMPSGEYYYSYDPGYFHDLYLNLLIGAGVHDRVELLLNLPLRYRLWPKAVHNQSRGGIRQKEVFYPVNFGVSDIEVMARYGLYSNDNNDQHLTLAGGIRVPTGSTADDVDPLKDRKVPLGDGSWDYGIALLYYGEMNEQLGLRVEGEYWFNGGWQSENAERIDYGDDYQGRVQLAFLINEAFQFNVGFQHRTFDVFWYEERGYAGYDFHNNLEVEAEIRIREFLKIRPRVTQRLYEARQNFFFQELFSRRDYEFALHMEYAFWS
jgi:hypothetical protein